MELVVAILFAGPLGYFCRNRAQGLWIYLGLFAVVFPIQTVLVNSDGQLDSIYWVVNAVFLGAGIALNALGARIRERRGGRVESASA